LKLDYAELDLENKEGFSDKEIALSIYDQHEESTVSLEYLSKIVTARYDEIFYFIREELKKI
jgi:cell division ATPase FtsA